MFFSTYQRKSTIDFSLRLDAPITGVVHNAPLFIESFLTSNTAKPRQEIIRGLITLSEHVKESLESELSYATQTPISTSIVRPFFWQSVDNKMNKQTNFDGIKYAIPGGVNFKNKIFTELMSALNSEINKDLDAHFTILGGGRDRNRFIA